MNVAEVIHALDICGRHRDCCIGCPYQNVSYVTRVGNTCKDVMHADAVYWMRQMLEDLAKL